MIIKKPGGFIPLGVVMSDGRRQGALKGEKPFKSIEEAGKALEKAFVRRK